MYESLLNDPTQADVVHKPHPRPIHELFLHKAYKPHPRWPSPVQPLPLRVSPVAPVLPVALPRLVARPGHPAREHTDQVAHRVVPAVSPASASAPTPARQAIPASRTPAAPAAPLVTSPVATIPLGEVSVTAAAQPWRPDGFQQQLLQLQDASVAAHKAFPLQRAYGWGPELEQRIRDEVRQAFIASLQEAYIDDQLGWTKWVPVVGQARTAAIYRQIDEPDKANLSAALAAADLVLTALDLQAIYSVAKVLARGIAAKAAAKAALREAGETGLRQTAQKGGRDASLHAETLLAAEFDPRSFADEIVELNKATEGGGHLLNGNPSAAINSALYYEKPAEQGAAIFRSISHGHMFIDGNKRTAVAVFKAFAAKHGLEVVSEARMVEVATQVAEGKVTDVTEIAGMLTK